MGTIPMLVVAGLIEGFFSQSNAPVAMKFSLAAVLFLALLAYLFRLRRAGGSGRHSRFRSLMSKY